MNPTRRDWLKFTGGAALAAAFAKSASSEPASSASRAQRDQLAPLIREYEKPMFDLPGQIPHPVIVESVEMLKRGTTYFVRTRSTDGAVGITGTKQVEDFIPIFEHIVAPYFIGRDARDLESLIDAVYRLNTNYKLASLPFWCSVAYVEQSLLDLMGKIANKPVGALLGGVIRKEVPIYLSGSERILTAEKEVDIYVRGVAATGAKAVKFKIGGRMSRNLDAYPGRTETLLKLAREKLGPNVLLRADSNGSYDPARAVEIGRLMESLNYEFFEEPCPFEELSETQAVARALHIPIAFGENNYNLWQFHWMLQNGVMAIVQPDINYNGGLIRAKRVARIAEEMGRTIVPHNTQTGANSVNIVQFASCTRNATKYMEYPWRAPQKAASWYKPDFKIVDGNLQVPVTPGMGLEIDPEFLAGATVVAKVTHSSGTDTSSG